MTKIGIILIDSQKMAVVMLTVVIFFNMKI